MAQQQTDYDSPWKTALEVYFPQCMELLFPEIYQQIDWNQSHEFLDKEFQKISRTGIDKRRYVDKLVKVHLVQGRETWLLFHIEVQNQPDEAFAERMYIYNYRIFDQFRRDVVSLAILGDTGRHYRPHSYERGLMGCETRFTFPTVKLLNFLQDQAGLEESDNPFAVVVLTHLKAGECRNDNEKKQLKFSLIKQLFQSGHQRGDIEKLLAFIDWLLHLPEAMEQELFAEINTLREEENMDYVTSWERMGEQKGIRIGEQKGEQRGIRIGEQRGIQIGEQRGASKGKHEFLFTMLEHRFGLVPDDIQQKCSHADPETLEVWGIRLLTAKTLDEVFDTGQ